MNNGFYQSKHINKAVQILYIYYYSIKGTTHTHSTHTVTQDSLLLKHMASRSQLWFYRVVYAVATKNRSTVRYVAFNGPTSSFPTIYKASFKWGHRISHFFQKNQQNSYEVMKCDHKFLGNLEPSETKSQKFLSLWTQF